MKTQEQPRGGTTTHAAWGGAGHPRLLITSEVDRLVHEITETRRGSDPAPNARSVSPGSPQCTPSSGTTEMTTTTWR